MLEDPPPAALNPAPEAPEAAELPPPEDAAEEAPRVVKLMSLVAPDPPELAVWELLDVMGTELLALPEYPDAARPPAPPALREKSARGIEMK